MIKNIYKPKYIKLYQQLQNKFCIQNTKYLNIVLFGSDYFPLPTLQKLHENSLLPTSSDDKIIDKLKVVTHVKNDMSKKITNQIQKYSLDQQLDLHMPIGNIQPSTKETRQQEWQQFQQEQLINQGYNMGIVCSFGFMIPNYIIDTFQGNMMVIHPSLLPKYRGASPIHYALLENQQETGVSFIKITKEIFDAGGIIKQTKIPIPQKQTYKELSQILSKNSSENVLEALKIYNDNNINFIEQEENLVTPAPKITTEDIKLDFKKSQIEVFCKFRALNGSSFSSARTFLDKEQILVEKMELPCEKQLDILEKQNQKLAQAELYNSQKPGTITLIKAKKYRNNVYVKCGDGQYIVIKEWRNTKMNRAKPTFYFIEKYLGIQYYDNQQNLQFI